MKYVFFIMSVFLLTSCFDKKEDDNTTDEHNDEGYVHIDARESLPHIFGEQSQEVNNTLTDAHFFVYAKSLEYSFININDGTVVEWEGPNNEVKGKVTMMPTGETRKKGCRKFLQEVMFEDKRFFGNGQGCFVNDHWVIKLKQKE